MRRWYIYHAKWDMLRFQHNCSQRYYAMLYIGWAFVLNCPRDFSFWTHNLFMDYESSRGIFCFHRSLLGCCFTHVLCQIFHVCSQTADAHDGSQLRNTGRRQTAILIRHEMPLSPLLWSLNWMSMSNFSQLCSLLLYWRNVEKKGSIQKW